MEQIQKDIDYIKGEARMARSRAERFQKKIKGDNSIKDAVNVLRFNMAQQEARELAYKLGVLIIEAAEQEEL